MTKKYTAVCRLCRREGEKLFLKGQKCYLDKCPVKRRPYGPGQHGKTAKNKQSDYKVRLREKQKARRMYGISERQFEKYFDSARKSKGVTGEKLLEALERRLDNVVFRLGFSPSRREGRQLVQHGHFLINSKRLDIPSYQVRLQDVIEVKPASNERIKQNIEKTKERKSPAWLSVDGAGLKGKVEAIPKREDIEAAIDELLIVEYYSR
ncbi:30S ribosomal protein S4 [Candidatus Margulisiibacteriota bacterium]